MEEVEGSVIGSILVANIILMKFVTEQDIRAELKYLSIEICSVLPITMLLMQNSNLLLYS